jgi:hypothetical protein
MNAEHAPADRSRAAAQRLTGTNEGDAAVPGHGDEAAYDHMEPAEAADQGAWDQWKPNRDLY